MNRSAEAGLSRRSVSMNSRSRAVASAWADRTSGDARIASSRAHRTALLMPGSRSLRHASKPRARRLVEDVKALECEPDGIAARKALVARGMRVELLVLHLDGEHHGVQHGEPQRGGDDPSDTARPVLPRHHDVLGAHAYPRAPQLEPGGHVPGVDEADGGGCRRAG